MSYKVCHELINFCIETAFYLPCAVGEDVIWLHKSVSQIPPIVGRMSKVATSILCFVGYNMTINDCQCYKFGLLIGFYAKSNFDVRAFNIICWLN